MSQDRSAFLSLHGQDLSRAQYEAAERRRADNATAAIRELRRDAASHRATAAFFVGMSRSEPDPRARRAHLSNATDFLRRAQAAEAQIRQRLPAVAPQNKDETR
jgi:hypothetical protein